MSPRVIDYRCATAPHHARRRLTLPQCLAERDAVLLLTRIDGQALAGKPAAERPGLIDTLWLLRADLADAVWVQSWADLGDKVTQAVVFAQLRQARGNLVVADEYVTDEAAAARFGADLLGQAKAAAELRQQISPLVKGEGSLDHPGDLGIWDTALEHARLAHRLKHTSRLDGKTIAEVLNRADYTATSRTGGFTGRMVSQLLADFDDELRVSGPDPIRLDMGTGPMLMVVSDDEPTALEALARHFAETGHSELPQRTQVVSALPRQRAALLEVARRCDLVDTVFIGADAMADDPLVLAVAISWLRQTGAVVIGATDAVDSGGYWDSELGRAMKAGTALFFRLRLYDTATVIEHSQTLDHAVREAHRLKATGLSYRAIGRELDKLGIPLRRPTHGGQWSVSAVHELLKEEENR
jgi:hypothetical protein